MLNLSYSFKFDVVKRNTVKSSFDALNFCGQPQHIWAGARGEGSSGS